MKAREGDFIRDLNGIIFDVKGLVHPPKNVVAFPRFISDSRGNRNLEGVRYAKIYSISERFKFLKQNYPNYLAYDPVFDEILCEVPILAVKEKYTPIQKLRELRKSESLDALQKLAVESSRILKETADISWDSFGVSGSIMAELHTPDSDIDLIVYGSKNCQKAHLALQNIMKNTNAAFKPYTRKELKALFAFRSRDTLMKFEDFIEVESRKAIQGKFMGKDYFMRFVKDWNEITEKYGEIQYKNMGYARIKATISEDSEAIFTPCSYAIENAKVAEGPKLQPFLEISSFRGRFCDQARVGEVVVAQGKVEKVMDIRRNREYFRLLLGNKPSDFMVLA